MKTDQLIRVRFIDAMLSQYGQFTRRMAMDVFGISEITASRDIAVYRVFDPQMHYCNRTKVFLADTDFKECPELWTCSATVVQFLKGIETVYDVRVGVLPVPTFGVHKA